MLLGAEMLLLGEVAATPAEARGLIEQAIADGRGFRKLCEIVEAQGGDPRALGDPDRLPRATRVVEVASPVTGVVEAIDAEAVGLAAMALGAGRSRVEDAVDPAAGLEVWKKVGDRVEAGEPLAAMHVGERPLESPDAVAARLRRGLADRDRAGVAGAARPGTDRGGGDMSRRADLHTRLEYARAWIRGRTEHRPAVGMVLGSGLGALAERMEDRVVIPFEEIPEFPAATVAGHAGKLVVGKLGGVPVAVLQGRAHLYEGASAEDVDLRGAPARLVRRPLPAPHQRGRRGEPRPRAGRAGPDHRPPEPHRGEPAHRVERRAARARGSRT